MHFNLSQPVGADTDEFLANWGEINRAVHDIAMAMGGSFSAEHGIGRLKRDDLKRYKSPVEIALMQRLKQALDPKGDGSRTTGRRQSACPMRQHRAAHFS